MLVAWLLAGRRLSILLDHVFTVSHASLPATPIVYEDGAFRIGELPLSFASSDDRGADISVRTDNSGRLVLSRDGQSFTLGRPAPVQEPSATPGAAVAPDPGDEVSFTVERSLMSWPTPFEMNFMTGHSPSWKRHLYYHLKWKKRSGARLDMIWRYQQWYYGSLGWSSGMMTGPDTGLIKSDMTPPRGSE